MDHARRLSKFAREAQRPLVVVISERVRESRTARSLAAMVPEVRYERDAERTLARARKHAPAIALVEGATAPALVAGPLLVLTEPAAFPWYTLVAAVVALVVVLCVLFV